MFIFTIALAAVALIVCVLVAIKLIIQGVKIARLTTDLSEVTQEQRKKFAGWHQIVMGIALLCTAAILGFLIIDAWTVS